MTQNVKPPLVREASTAIASISVNEVKAALADNAELGFFDLREEVNYAKGHILYAAHLPLSRIEIQVRALVPRLDTRIVLTDGGEHLAAIAARILLDAGYSDVALLDGGNEAWEKAGFPLYTGRNVPSIGFAEVVEHELHTPNITAVELKQRLDRGDDVVVLDTRPREEFEAFHIPGAVNAPGAEILHRLGELDIGPETLLVANCAGRTRSILGAQSLINAGVQNPVASLSGGTMEWLIAGYSLDHGPGPTAPIPLPEHLGGVRELAETLANKANVRRIDPATLARFEAEQGRTLFRFDVRTPEEYAGGHLPGFRSAQGGQLVSGTERFVGVLRSRVVLHDPEGVRDLLTASWLVQLGGYEIFVLTGASQSELEAGAETRLVIGSRDTRAPSILPQTLQALLAEGGVQIFDLAGPNQYRKAHIPGAVHTPRTGLAEAVAAGSPIAIITSEDGVLAQILASQLRHALGKDVRAVLGGTAAWRARGLPTEKGGLADEAGGDLPDRYALAPARRNELFRDYLNWELSLVAKLTADVDAQANFRIRSFQSASA